MLSSITAARLMARISMAQSKYWCVGRQERRKRKERKRKVEGKTTKKTRQSRKGGSLDWVSLKQGLPDASSVVLLRSVSLFHIWNIALSILKTIN